MYRAAIFVAVAIATLAAARAAELDGITMPDTQTEHGVTLRLNGMGIRTYSILRIRIYVAGLYLEHPSNSGEAVLQSPEMKLLRIHFIRGVDKARSANAWREGMVAACPRPCVLDQNDLDRFLARVPAVHDGDESQILFTPQGADVSFNGHSLGEIRDAHFAEVMLASFIGPHPPTENVKRGLLGDHE